MVCWWEKLIEMDYELQKKDGFRISNLSTSSRAAFNVVRSRVDRCSKTIMVDLTPHEPSLDFHPTLGPKIACELNLRQL